VDDPAANKVLSSAGEFAWGGAASTAFFVDPAHALALILEEAIRMVYGPTAKGVEPPGFLQGPIEMLGLLYPSYRLFLIALSGVVALAVWGFLQRTRAGLVIRAVAQDEETARTMGINFTAIVLITFAIGSALAAIAGVMEERCAAKAAP